MSKETALVELERYMIQAAALENGNLRAFLDSRNRETSRLRFGNMRAKAAAIREEGKERQ